MPGWVLTERTKTSITPAIQGYDLELEDICRNVQKFPALR